MAVRLSSLSTEYVKVPVKVTEEGSVIDPTAYDVEMAFIAEGEPEAADWKEASWETAGTKYLARCLVGPAGTVTLSDDSYTIWVRVTSSPEIPIKRSGTLVVE